MHGCVSAGDTRSMLRKYENEKDRRRCKNWQERRDRFLSAFVLVSLSLCLFLSSLILDFAPRLFAMIYLSEHSLRFRDCLSL